MQCPSCGREIPEQGAFCPYCGASVGGQPAPAAPAPVEPAPAGPPPAPPRPAPPRRRSRAGCWLTAILVVIVVLAILLGVWWFVGRRILTNWLVARWSPTLTENLDFSNLGGQVWSGTYTEDELNDDLQYRLPADMGPVDDVSVKLRSGAVELRFRIYGVESSLRAEVKKWQSGVKISNPEAGGVLGWAIEPAIIAKQVEQAINDELKQNDVRLTELKISSRGVTLSVEPR